MTKYSKKLKKTRKKYKGGAEKNFRLKPKEIAQSKFLARSQGRRNSFFAKSKNNRQSAAASRRSVKPVPLEPRRTKKKMPVIRGPPSIDGMMDNLIKEIQSVIVNLREIMSNKNESSESIKKSFEELQRLLQGKLN